MRLTEKIKNCIRKHRHASVTVLGGAVIASVLAVSHNGINMGNHGGEALEKTVSVIHFGDEGTERLEARDSFSFDTKSFSPFAFIFEEETYTKEAVGEDYKVTVTYTDAAQIPEEAVLEVREIGKDTKEYTECYQKMVETMLANGDAKDEIELNIISNRFFDISFQLNGEEIEPKETVNVQIDLKKKESEDVNDIGRTAAYSTEEDTKEVGDYTILHFKDDGNVEIQKSNSERNAEMEDCVVTSFSLDSFSIIGAVETDSDINWDHEDADQSSYWMNERGGRPFLLGTRNRDWFSIYENQRIYVYAKEGETVFFGSSSRGNLDENLVTEVMSRSIGKISNNENSISGKAKAAWVGITLPYNETTKIENGTISYEFYDSSKNNDETLAALSEAKAYQNNKIYLISREEAIPKEEKNIITKGLIRDHTQEKGGAKYIVRAESESRGYNKDGYPPYAFTAPVEGVYTFRFFGTGTGNINKNPESENSGYRYKEISDDTAFTEAPINCENVAAWDVTVVNGDGKRETGRVFTDALQWCTAYGDYNGTNVEKYGLFQKVYVLTSDGFEYSIDFNGIAPVYFLFYANRRGLLTENKSRTESENTDRYQSLYQSVKYPDSLNDGRDEEIFNAFDINLNLFSDNKDEIDEAYYIFFEKEISEAVIDWYTKGKGIADSIDAIESKIVNFKVPDIEEGKKGGEFSFTYNPTNGSNGIEPLSYEIKLDFTGEDGELNIVRLPGAKLKEGINIVKWDGKDSFGNTVPAGTDLTKVTYLIAKAGETHFPLIDVEGNVNGIKIKRENTIIDEGNRNLYWIYYNNDGIVIQENPAGQGSDQAKDYTGKNDGVYSGRKYRVDPEYFENSESKGIADCQNYALTGTDSSEGIMGWPEEDNGNQVIIDPWVAYEVQIKAPSSNFIGTINWDYTNSDGSVVDSEPPTYSDVVLQYRLIDRGDVNTKVEGWKIDDTDSGWRNYENNLYVKLNGSDIVTEIKYSASTPYTYVRIENDKQLYEPSENEPRSGYGKCEFLNLPEYDIIEGKYYQYRIVDRRILDGAGDRVVYYYTHRQQFNESSQKEITVGSSRDNLTLYKQEDLYYKYEAEDSEIKIQQLWDDTDLISEWISKNRPEAVKALLLYGVKKTATSLPGYETETIGSEEIVWYPYHTDAIVELKTTKNNDTDYTISSDGYTANHPVKKNAPDGKPYYYKVIPVSYSVNSAEFASLVDKENQPFSADSGQFMNVGRLIPDCYDLIEHSYIYFDGSTWVRTKVPSSSSAEENLIIATDTVTVTDKPKTFGLKLVKITDAGLDNWLQGAEFTLKMENKAGETIAYTYNGEAVVRTSGADGIFSVEGLKLPVGTYELAETKAPNGYLIRKPVMIEIGANGISSVTSDHVPIGEGYFVQEADNTYTLRVANSSGTLLPLTGGPGTKLYQLAGILFLFAGGAVVALKRRRVHEW